MAGRSHLIDRLFSSSEEVSDFAEWLVDLTLWARPFEDCRGKPEHHRMKLTEEKVLEFVEAAKCVNTWFVVSKDLVMD